MWILCSLHLIINMYLICEINMNHSNQMCRWIILVLSQSLVLKKKSFFVTPFNLVFVQSRNCIRVTNLNRKFKIHIFYFNKYITVSLRVCIERFTISQKECWMVCYVLVSLWDNLSTCMPQILFVKQNKTWIVKTENIETTPPKIDSTLWPYLHTKFMSYQVEGTTERSKRPVHSSPGFNVIGFSIAAPSTHTICLYSSSPKSTIALDFFSHGFQTTMQHQTWLVSPVTLRTKISLTYQHHSPFHLEVQGTIPTSGSPSFLMTIVCFFSWSRTATPLPPESRYTRSTWYIPTIT